MLEETWPWLLPTRGIATADNKDVIVRLCLHPLPKVRNSPHQQSQSAERDNTFITPTVIQLDIPIAFAPIVILATAP